MVGAAAAASGLFPTVHPSPSSSTKAEMLLLDNLCARGIRQHSSSRKRLQQQQVKARAQPSPKINGKNVNTAESDRDNGTFVNLLPNWSMLLATITSIFLTNLDRRPKRTEMLDDQFGLDGLVFRRRVAIRSYEIGADRSASIETVMNHLQEAALNHVASLGLLGDGFGATLEMSKRDLIWVVTRVHVLVDRYPAWGDFVEVETWVGASGRNGMRRDWLVRDCQTGQILTRATSVWVMMNKWTRRLSKIPEEVRREIEPFFIEKVAVTEEDSRKLQKLSDITADYVQGGLSPRWNDLDVNQHGNNVKHVGSILEERVWERECVAVLTAVSGGSSEGGGIECEHSLKLENGSEVVRARTEWRPKRANSIKRVNQIPATSS